MLSTSHLREKSIDEARQVVNQVNMEGEFQISDERVLQLITQLTSLMIQVQVKVLLAFYFYFRSS